MAHAFHAATTSRPSAWEAVTGDPARARSKAATPMKTQRHGSNLMTMASFAVIASAVLGLTRLKPALASVSCSARARSKSERSRPLR